MKRGGLWLAALIAMAAPGSAQASTVELRFVGKTEITVGRTETKLVDAYTLTYRADAGEENRARMRFLAPGVRIEDSGATFRDLPPSCRSSGTAVDCLPPPGDSIITQQFMELGDGGDEAIDHGAQSRIDMGPGADTLRAESISAGTSWVGGAGPDRLDAGNSNVSVSYADRPDPVSVTLDGLPDDGAAGEGDNVTGAPGEIQGGEAGDRLRGPTTVGPRPGGFRLIGNGGDDDLRSGASGGGIEGGAGADRVAGEAGPDWINGGPGPDVLRGGGGRDRVLYDKSSAAVTVTLDDAADDGVAGERDNVATDVEEVLGTPAGDVIVGTARDDTLLGGGGPDRLDARAGDDRLNLLGSGGEATGGPGRDALTVDGAPHRLRLADGEKDTVECSGLGEVTIERDRIDLIQRCLPARAAYGGGRRARVGKRGRVTLPVRCSPEGRPCSGVLELRRRGTRGRVVGRRRFLVSPGGRERVVVQLSRAARKRVRRTGRLPVRLQLRASGKVTHRRVVTLLRARR